jgi:hypothetical protein
VLQGGQNRRHTVSEKRLSVFKVNAVNKGIEKRKGVLLRVTEMLTGVCGQVYIDECQ